MREVRIKDTLSGELTALDSDSEVGIYACGPTVYSRIHIGNARPFVVFSLFARFLRGEGYPTRLVVNVTDINDKIYAAAAEAGEPSAEFAARMTAAYMEDTGRLGLGRPDSEPLASETVDGIVALIAELVEGGHAYESGGDVYFRVGSFDGYGKLSNRRPEDMDQGEEAGAESLKESPLDFALWKSHKEGEDTSWDSPWGPGRPAWHIECSVMAERELGPSFAIHGGGSDLVFPHHENEIAQSEAAGRGFARIWMHNGMIETDAEKMSKSEGNIFQLSEALDRYGREAVVLYLVSGHYRQPLAFSAEQMEQAVAQVERLRNFFREHPAAEGGRRGSGGLGTSARGVQGGSCGRLQHPAGAGRAVRVGRGGEPWRGTGSRRQAALEMVELLGLESLAEAEEGADEEAERLLAEREEARAAKDFGRADEIRDRLAELGWEVRDADGRRAPRAEGLRWRGNQTIYGKRPVEEAERGRRPVHRVWRAPETLGRGAGAALRVTRPPGRRRRGRSLSLRRPQRAAAQGGRADRRPRPGPGPPQSRRGLPLGRAGRRRGRRHPRTAGGGGDGGRPARPRRARSSTCRSPASATSPTGSRRRKRRGSGSGAPTPAPTLLPGMPTSAAPRSSSWVGRGAGFVPVWRPPATASSPCRSAEGSIPSTSPPPRPRCSSRPSASERDRRGSNCNGGCTNVCSGLTE